MAFPPTILGIEDNNRGVYPERRVILQPYLGVADIYRTMWAQLYWTVLITGPMQFVRLVHSYLSNHLDNIYLHESTDLEVRMIDGYRRILSNPSSRLGWRIVTYINSPENIEGIITRTLIQGNELFDCLPQDYRQMHLENIEILRKIRDGQLVTGYEEQNIVRIVGMSLQEIEGEIRGEERIDEHEDEIVGSDIAAPRIICTSLVGAKGLQAGHVFITGLNNAHFPRDNQHPTDNEIRCFLVALTRTRKCCYALSCGWFGDQLLEPSIFVDWIKPFYERVDVNQNYFRRT